MKPVVAVVGLSILLAGCGGSEAPKVSLTSPPVATSTQTSTATTATTASVAPTKIATSTGTEAQDTAFVQALTDAGLFDPIKINLDAGHAQTVCGALAQGSSWTSALGGLTDDRSVAVTKKGVAIYCPDQSAVMPN